MTPEEMVALLSLIGNMKNQLTIQANQIQQLQSELAQQKLAELPSEG